ncbi:MAG: hypothetical protein CFE28_04315 [Alphaproteobacteria bacterium PA2]|nr:MAG: hypothetical protein CFE28_04315 [Alphaproteobacteria bacterium PA2]
MSELQDQLAAILADQLGDEALAGRMAAHLLEAGANWRPPIVPMAEADSIIAYAFGNRPRQGPAPPNDAPLMDRLDEPGPVNAALARAVAEFHAIRPARIFAQWEVAHFLNARHGLTDAVSIEPVLGPDGQVIYLSTDGVAAAALAAGGGDLGKVAVVAHRDHAKRCVKVSRAAGMDAFVAADIPLPADYDPQSGQAWTRSREVYLLHDLAAQFMGLRAEAIGRMGS